MPENKSKQTCKQCGTCCRKGGPSFHKEDKPLIDKGTIPLKYLFTIRKGEPVHENVKGGVMAATTEIIKIKGKGASWTCLFLNEEANACTIYENRPVECRELTCWDTRKIEAIYEKNRLSRKDLLSQVDGLWSLVTDHQERCSYEKLKELAVEAQKDIQGEAAKSILEMVRYDAHLRHVVVEKGGLDSGMIEFLFGRPISKTIHGFGLKVTKDLTALHPVVTMPE
jgi:Fe-S-cluster containining protein